MIDFNNLFRNRRSLLTASAKILMFVVAAGTCAAFGQSLDRISCVTKTYSSAGTDTCRAFLTATNSTHLYIALSSNNPAVTVPAGVTVSLNAGSKGFTANVAKVSTAQTATITAKLNGVSKSFQISLTPSSSGTAKMSVDATSIAFGSVIVNSPQEQAVKISSVGTSAVTVKSAAVTGTGFTVSGPTFPVVLNPGQSVSLQVQFDPTKAGSYSGQLSIASSASTASIPLSGTGASHQVDLSWNAPSGSSPVAGYNIYRALTGSTSFQRLNSSVDPSPGYTDGAVQSATSYDYKVTSVSSTGVESAASNKISVKVP